jgi:hypothetical protein
MSDLSHRAAARSTPGRAASASQLKHPPRTPLALRVGVVGHRPDSKKRSTPDAASLRATCRTLLSHIQAGFSEVWVAHREDFCDTPPRDDGKPPGLRVVSSLAEGADQWLASESEQLGYEIQAVLPFERSEYRKDFTDDAVLNEYQRLLELATAVFELDGCRARAGDSYLAAARVLLNQTDLLIAIWDGKDAQGTGGTGQVVREALQRHVPTVWINWEAPAEWRLMTAGRQLLGQRVDVPGDVRLLTRQVTELLVPPAASQAAAKPHREDLRTAYFADRRRSWTPLGGWWNFFRDLVTGKPGALAIRVREFITETQKRWQQDWTGPRGEVEGRHSIPAEIIKWSEENYLPHYAWANQLSVYYANHFRSSFAWIYLLGALAVLLALIGKTAHVSHALELVFISAEVIVICIIIGLTWYGRRRRWHERWIDYRTLAERLRLVRFNSLLGGVWHNVNVPSHLATYGNPAATWMHWHARAVERAAGLPQVVVSPAYLSACRELVLYALIGEQGTYHKRNADRLGSVDHRLHRLGEMLFLATLIACVIHLAVASFSGWFGEAAEKWDRWLIFFAAFLPALGAAMAAIRSQGEFHRVVQRSRAMREELDQLRQAVAELPIRANELDSQLLQQAVEQATRLMYNEVLDWRIVFQDRPLVWPA